MLAKKNCYSAHLSRRAANFGDFELLIQLRLAGQLRSKISLTVGMKIRCKFAPSDMIVSYGRKLVTALSGGVFDLLDPVLERYSFDEFSELA